MAHVEDIHLHNQLNSNNIHKKLNDAFRPRTKAARGLTSHRTGRRTICSGATAHHAMHNDHIS